MTDDERPDVDEPGFEDSPDAWVRDLLASARDTGPVPDDVAARLDATLASLRAERVGANAHRDGDDTVVVPLRRRLAPLVAAAAAVVLVGGGAVGVTQLARGGSSSQSSAGSSQSSASADRAGGSTTSPRTSEAPADQVSGDAAAVALPRLSSATFAQDAASVMRAFAVDRRGASASGGTPGTLSGATPDTSPAPSGDTPMSPSTAQPRAEAAEKGAAPPVTATPGAEALVAPVAACPGPQVAGAIVVPATLDGSPVALLFRPPSATAQRVEAWSCDGATLLAAASVRR